MKFSEIIDQASALLKRTGRLSYRALKREFELDDAALEDLKDELIEIQELAADKYGKMLVWTGDQESTREELSATHSARRCWTYRWTLRSSAAGLWNPRPTPSTGGARHE